MNISEIIGLPRPIYKRETFEAPSEGDFVTFQQHPNIRPVPPDRYVEGETYKVKETRWYEDQLITRCVNGSGKTLPWTGYQHFQYLGDTQPKGWSVTKNFYRLMGPCLNGRHRVPVGTKVRYMGPPDNYNDTDWGAEEGINPGHWYEVTQQQGDYVKVDSERDGRYLWIPKEWFQHAGNECTIGQLHERFQRRSNRMTWLFWHDGVPFNYYGQANDTQRHAFDIHYDHEQEEFILGALHLFDNDVVVHVPEFQNSQFIRGIE